MRPRANKKFEKWDLKSVRPLSPSLRDDPPPLVTQKVADQEHAYDLLKASVA